MNICLRGHGRQDKDDMKMTDGIDMNKYDDFVKKIIKEQDYCQMMIL